MKTLLLLLAILALISCGKKELILTNSVFSKVYSVDGDNIKGRLIYIHYINGNADLMNLGYFGDIKRGFINKGYQVISINCPKVDQNSFIDGGANYLKNYLGFLDSLMNDVNEKYGQANETIIGGISFGGIHTLIAMAHRGQYFDKYFTIVGITKITTLPLFKGQLVPYFDAFNVKDNLIGKNGLMIYANNDNITNNNLTFNLVDYLNVDSILISGTAHTVGQSHVDAILNWVQ